MRNNVVADCHDAAVWEDCWGLGLLLYGNTMYNLGGDGFYIEAGVRGTVLQWNTVFDCGHGVGFRENWANVAFENYFFHNKGGVGIGTCDASRGVKADAVMYNWLIDNGMGSAFGPNAAKEPAQIFDHNIYKFQNWPDVDLRGRKPAAAKIDKTVHVEMTMDNWPGTNLRGRFLARWTGAINAEKDGEHRFYVETHEFNGARLSLDGKPVVCNGEAKASTPSSKEREYRLPLKAGNHEIMLEFYHGMADHLWKSCIFSWQPPGGVKAVIPEHALFHKEPGEAELQPGLKAEFFDIRNDPLPVDPTNKAVILQYGNKQYKDLQSLRGGGAGNAREGGDGVRSGAAGAGDFPRAWLEEVLEAGADDRQPRRAATGRSPGRQGLSLFLEEGKFSRSGALWLAGRRQRLERRRLRLGQHHSRRRLGVPAGASGPVLDLDQRPLRRSGGDTEILGRSGGCKRRLEPRPGLLSDRFLSARQSDSPPKATGSGASISPRPTARRSTCRSGPWHGTSKRPKKAAVSMWRPSSATRPGRTSPVNISSAPVTARKPSPRIG